MPRIRTIKPSFWSDESVACMSNDARLLCIGLISYADDDGRFLASTAAIAGYVFPFDEVPPAKIRRWLDELVDHEVIHRYRVGRAEYGCFPNWHKHQVIDRYTASILPPPDVETYARKSRSDAA